MGPEEWIEGVIKTGLTEEQRNQIMETVTRAELIVRYGPALHEINVGSAEERGHPARLLPPEGLHEAAIRGCRQAMVWKSNGRMGFRWAYGDAFADQWRVSTWSIIAGDA
jgi:hypothetical protein